MNIYSNDMLHIRKFSLSILVIYCENMFNITVRIGKSKSFNLNFQLNYLFFIFINLIIMILLDKTF